MYMDCICTLKFAYKHNMPTNKVSIKRKITFDVRCIVWLCHIETDNTAILLL